VPSSRFFLAGGLVTLLLAASVAVAWMAVAALVLDGLLLAAFLLDVLRARGTRVSAARRWPPLLFQGARTEVEVRLASAAGRAVVVRAREALHPGLAAGPLRTEARLPRDRTVVWKYALAPRRRGEHAVGPLTARVLGPWGLAWAQRDVIPSESRRVYPRVRWEGTLGRLLALAHRRELGQSPVRLHGGGTEPYALREYRPGDPRNKIHWKATARHGRPILREDTWERGARVLVLLDCARTMASLDGGLSKLDHALAAALALTRVAVSRGDRVTLLAFSDRVERVVRVRSGTHSLFLAYRALFDVEARLTEPAYDLAAEAACDTEARRATVVVLTSVTDLAAAELLRSAILTLSRRHRPILVNLEDPELADLAYGVPASPEAAFAKALSLEILLGNRRLAKQLRRSGVRVATTRADRLAWEAVAAYLMAGSGKADVRPGAAQARA
jgi:uncharacterized protein (DUF58 family)